MKRGPFEVLNSKTVYKNPWITVREDEVKRPDGANGIFGIVEYGEGVSVLVFDERNNVCLIREYMYAIDKEDIMLVSGGVGEREDPLDAAKRELLEEIGLRSDNWVELGLAHPLTMVIKSPFNMFVALNCRKVADGEREIKMIKRTFDEVLDMVEKGEISHSGSLSTIFKAKLYFDKASQ